MLFHDIAATPNWTMVRPVAADVTLCPFTHMVEDTVRAVENNKALQVHIQLCRRAYFLRPIIRFAKEQLNALSTQISLSTHCLMTIDTLRIGRVCLTIDILQLKPGVLVERISIRALNPPWTILSGFEGYEMPTQSLGGHLILGWGGKSL